MKVPLYIYRPHPYKNWESCDPLRVTVEGRSVFRIDIGHYETEIDRLPAKVNWLIETESGSFLTCHSYDQEWLSNYIQIENNNARRRKVKHVDLVD